MNAEINTVEAIEAQQLDLPEELRRNPETGEPVDVILVQSEDSVGTED